jgi:hypothetical protein
MSKSNRFISTNSGKSNSRFSILDEPSVPKENTNTNTKREKGSGANSFLNSRGNSRFESLKDEPIPIVNDSISNRVNDSISNRVNVMNNRNNSFKTATVVVKKEEPIIQPLIIKEGDFPDLISSVPKKTETTVNKWAAIVKKEAVVEVKESEEDKLPNVAPGWVCIRKNPKTGRSETIQGPLTEEQKEYERIRYLEQYDFKYNLYKTIERMSERWDEYKEQFDEKYGHGAYNEQYGICESDEDEDEDDDYNESDSDSEYEYE